MKKTGDDNGQEYVISDNELRELGRMLVTQSATRTSGDGLLTGDKLLTRAEVCGILRIGTTTLYKLDKAGTLTPVKIGRRCLYRSEDIVGYLNNHVKQPRQVVDNELQ